MSRVVMIGLYITILVALSNYGIAQVYLEKRSNGHADISLWYKIGKFKIVLGPCITTGRDQENITIHVSTIKKMYSYQDVWLQHSPSPMKLCKGTIKLDTVNGKIIVDLYEEKEGKIVPLIINGKHKMLIEEFKMLVDGERLPDLCIFNDKH